jgi:hypothetical protein
MKKMFEVYFSGLVRVEAEDQEDAWESVTNEEILDNVKLDEIREVQ